jgi:hypothetical protein
MTERQKGRKGGERKRQADKQEKNKCAPKMRNT